MMSKGICQKESHICKRDGTLRGCPYYYKLLHEIVRHLAEGDAELL